MKIISSLFTLMCLSSVLFSQINFTANDTVPEFSTPFRLSVNPNFNGSQWTDQILSNIAAGLPSENVEGVGVKSFRVPLPENFLDYWGYDIRVNAFQHYSTVDVKENTVFLEAPADHHRDTTNYCPGQQSAMFANMYEPIWDGGLNGTPVNDDNYAALYIYKTVSLYKDYVKFWEIWNEPDLDNSGTGWMPIGQSGNWYENVPSPCQIQMRAPVYHYIRLLRISYEVIKSVDPEAYVTTGGIGYESFLDLILRHTDNPNGGEVTAEYPLKGGAYFDVLSYHTYPHINGSLKLWDNSIGGFAYTRHSDKAVDGTINLKNNFESILYQYGYNNQIYPKKIFILTETTIPRKQFEDYIGSDAAARNYFLKLQVEAYRNKIRQVAIYQLADQNTFANGSNWLEMAGLYKQISNSQPYDITPNESGIACRTMTKLIFGKKYDADATAALNLPNEIRGGAFIGGTSPNDTLYVLWAKTGIDQSEVAAQDFNFPSNLGFTNVQQMNWDFSVTNDTIMNNNNVQLTGAPAFFKGIFTEEPISNLNLNLINEVTVHPNPFKEFFQIQFNLPAQKNAIIKIYDVQGKLVLEEERKNLQAGENVILIEALHSFEEGMYFGNIEMEGEIDLNFKVLKK